MDQHAERTRKKRLPYWAALLLGILGCAIVANILTIGLQFGAFNPWQSLPAALPGAARIVDADETHVWVATGDGSIFTYELYCVGSSSCREWQPVRNASDIKPARVVPLARGPQCPKSAIGLFPIGPAGEVVECVLSAFPGPEMGSVTYYALMADGTVRLWRNSNSILGAQVFFFLSTIILPVVVAITISAFYLGMHVGRKRQAEDQARADHAPGDLPPTG